MTHDQIVAWSIEHALGLLIFGTLLFGVIAAQVRGNSSKRSIAHLKDRNERLLRIMEKISGIRADEV